MMARPCCRAAGARQGVVRLAASARLGGGGGGGALGVNFRAERAIAPRVQKRVVAAAADAAAAMPAPVPEQAEEAGAFTRSLQSST